MERPLEMYRLQKPDWINQICCRREHFQETALRIRRHIGGDLIATFSYAKKMPETLTIRERNYILEDAKKIWKMMTDVKNWKMKMPHDGYLKLFQLQNPNLQDAEVKGRKLTHDVLMIDEGQDMNPAMLEIFSHQNITKIIVGDPSQQIYMFRGAVNALGSLDSN